MTPARRRSTVALALMLALSAGACARPGPLDPSAQPTVTPTAAAATTSSATHIAVTGDSDTGDDQERSTVNEMVAQAQGHPYNALLLLGDLVYLIGDPAQTQWLEDALAAQQDAGVWTVVAMHKPAYSAGDHGWSLHVRAAWAPLFDRYDVPLVLAGHDHDYQRSTPQNGVVYVVSGAASELRPTGRELFTAVSTSRRHFLDLVADGDRMVVRAINQQGNVLDTFTLTR